MRMPAYPLITVDPYFSLWSNTENLYDSDTIMWYGRTKRLSGTIEIDGKTFRFMGKGRNAPIKQISRTVSPYITYYEFADSKIKLSAEFYTPLIIDELRHLGSPVSFIDYTVISLDGNSHDVKITTSLGAEVCWNKTLKETEAGVISYSNVKMAKMGLKKQEPLSQWGDGCSAEWGYYYLCGGTPGTGRGKDRIFCRCSSIVSDEAKFHIIAAYDDVYSIEYMGKKTKGIWTSYYQNIEECICFYRENRELIHNKLLKQNERILADAAPFGRSYQSVVTAAARQILAGHKLIKDENGELLYLSKECYSNGSINTVDVSYPAQPFFLVYNPQLVKGMLTGIFRYAEGPAWKHDFAPHDLGTYPIADGQTYALIPEMEKYRREIFSVERDYHTEKYQMPVEESGNMLVMTYAYYEMSKDTAVLSRHFDTLKKWADFLVCKGIVLDSQLCTDDFAGHSEKNVNLAIKSVMGIACFGRICKALGKEDVYGSTAEKLARELISLSDTDKYLSFAIGAENTWSLKYNMVWDVLFGFGFFGEDIYKAESDKYKTLVNTYGIPLDYRRDFTKSDWEMWAACLDKTGENVNLFSETMLKYLSDTTDRYPFSDWFETVEPRECSFRHRTVQGGLWMPVLKNVLCR